VSEKKWTFTTAI